ncbi:MAG: hypothetical protein K2J86_09020 [Prevotella sp.]|nr:hypothetical protein [Prevotella sp.]
MKVNEKFKEYIWLVNTIHTARKITLNEIQEKWPNTELSGGVELKKLTFYHHKNCHQLRLRAKDGKMRLTDVADTELDRNIKKTPTEAGV